MRTLTSKIQYSTFEQGEFVEERERTCEEVLQLIKDFPWATQREDIQITLTVPSVTIENEKGQFLKFAPYFKGKYVLYFLDCSNRLYKKSYVRIEDHFPHIEAFFSDEGLDISEFKKENTWLQHPEKDFYSQDFHYQVTGSKARRYIVSTSLINILGGLVFTGMIIFGWHKLPLIVIAMMVLMICYIGGVLNLLVVLGYYLYSKDKLLIMSRGNDIFYFGSKDAPKQYNKNDIEKCITRRRTGYRHPLSSFSVMDIYFKDGTIIKLPNIIVDNIALSHKLYMCKHEKNNKFPDV